MDDTNTSNKRSLDLQPLGTDTEPASAVSSGTELKETYRSIPDEGILINF